MHSAPKGRWNVATGEASRQAQRNPWYVFHKNGSAPAGAKEFESRFAIWVYEHSKGNCDHGLAIFDPINHRLTIHGLHYHYHIHQPDITALSYLSDWGLPRDVHLTVTMNTIPFDLVLSRYSPLSDLPAAILPYITTRRLIKLTRETFGEVGG